VLMIERSFFSPRYTLYAVKLLATIMLITHRFSTLSQLEDGGVTLQAQLHGKLGSVNWNTMVRPCGFGNRLGRYPGYYHSRAPSYYSWVKMYNLFCT
jgi:hypothetical protein